MRISSATNKDIPSLLVLEQLCFDTDQLIARNFRYLINRDSVEFLVVKENGELIGSGVVLYRRGSRQCRLYSLAVHPKHRRYGVAGKLIQQLFKKAKARGCESMVLEVRVNNKRAIAFYERRAFEVFGVIKQFYEDKSDAYRMRKVF